VELIVGMLGRKDASGFFPHFAGLARHVFTTAFDSPNATPPQDLADAACAAGLQAEAVDGVTVALQRALAEPGPPPHVIICGSLHFVGDVLAMAPENLADLASAARLQAPPPGLALHRFAELVVGLDRDDLEAVGGVDAARAGEHRVGPQRHRVVTDLRAKLRHSSTRWSPMPRPRAIRLDVQQAAAGRGPSPRR